MEEKDNSTFNIPSFHKEDAYAFVAPETGSLYLELSAISEEIIKCRSQKLQNS